MQWDIPPGWVNYFAPLVHGELFNLHWNSIALLQAGSTETQYTCNRTCTIKKGVKVGILLWQIPPPVYLLTPAGPASPSQHVRYAQPGQIPKAAPTLTSEVLGTSVILIEGEQHPIQVPTKYLFSTLDFCCFYRIQSVDEHILFSTNTFCFLPIQSFGLCLYTLHWPGGHYKHTQKPSLNSPNTT